MICDVAQSIDSLFDKLQFAHEQLLLQFRIDFKLELHAAKERALERAQKQPSGLQTDADNVPTCPQSLPEVFSPSCSTTDAGRVFAAAKPGSLAAAPEVLDDMLHVCPSEGYPSAGQLPKSKQGTFQIPAALDGWFTKGPLSSKLRLSNPMSTARTAVSTHNPSGASPVLDAHWHDLSSSISNARRVTLKSSVICDVDLDFEGSDHPPVWWPWLTAAAWLAFVVQPLSPYNKVRILWDTFGIVLVMSDMIVIPVDVAWDRQQSGFEIVLFHVSIVFWSCDVLLTMNTSIDKQGRIETSRRVIMQRYAQTWLMFDLAVLSLDCFFLFAKMPAFVGAFRAARVIRVLRTLRIIRILKFGRFSQIIEDICFKYDQAWLALSSTIVRSLLTIVLIAHMGGCLWFFTGKSLQGPGVVTWLTPVDPGGERDFWDTYTMSMHYVLGHLTAAPVDARVGCETAYERAFLMVTIVCSLLVLGTAVSNISHTMQEIHAGDAALANVRRQLRRYFKAMDTPVELSSRAMHFVQESLKNKSSISLHPAVTEVLSDTLTAELILRARSKYIIDHPFFAIISEKFPAVYACTCSAFIGTLHAPDDIVFKRGHWSAGLYIIIHGDTVLKAPQTADNVGEKSETMTHFASRKSLTPAHGRRLSTRAIVATSSEDRSEVVFGSPAWFSESSLFARTVHRSTLASVQFCNTYFLTGTKFAECVKQSPSCTVLVMKYAKAYLSSLWEGGAYDIPEDKLLVQDWLPVTLAESCCATLFEKDETIKTIACPPQGSEAATRELVAGIHKGTLAGEDVMSRLPEVFGELHDTEGLYAQISDNLEQKRVMTAMMSVCWLLGDSYEDFVAEQPLETRMSKSLWEEWQDFLHLLDLTEEMVHTLLVFLCIRGLGKSELLAQRLELYQWSSQGVIVQQLLIAQLLPSVDHLSEDMTEMLESIIKFHDVFNLPQFLQAENLPYHIEALDQCIKEKGEKPWKCYLLGIAAMMCGLGAHKTMKGSCFMDDRNGRMVLLGIRCLQQVGTATPQAIYWNYVSLRASTPDFPMNSPDRYVLGRLACLTRASNEDLGELLSAWATLPFAERRVLISAFLADGLTMKATVFRFLPLYLEKATKNPAAGLGPALEILVSLGELLQKDKHRELTSVNVIEVNLSALAIFAEAVRCPQVFRQVPQHSHFVQADDSTYRHLVNRHLWCQVRDTTHRRDYDLQEVAQALAKIERDTLAVQQLIVESIHEPTRVVTQESQPKLSQGVVQGACKPIQERIRLTL